MYSVTCGQVADDNGFVRGVARVRHDGEHFMGSDMVSRPCGVNIAQPMGVGGEEIRCGCGSAGHGSRQSPFDRHQAPPFLSAEQNAMIAQRPRSREPFHV